MVFYQELFCHIRPLTRAYKGLPSIKMDKRLTKSKSPIFKGEPFIECWDEECTKPFHNTIYCLTNAPVLAYTKPSKPYVLHIDASLNGLGAVLNQEHPVGLRPTVFATHKLSSSEQRYPIHQLEIGVEMGGHGEVSRLPLWSKVYSENG